MKNRLVIFSTLIWVAAFWIVAPQTALSSETQIPVNSDFEQFTHSRIDDATVVEAQKVTPSPAEEQIIKKLKEARLAGDKSTAGALQAQLDSLNGIDVHLAIQDGALAAPQANIGIPLEAEPLAWDGDVLVTVSHTDSDTVRPSMDEADNGDLYLVMQNGGSYEIYRSTNGGASWYHAFYSAWGSDYLVRNPSIACANGRVYVAHELYHLSSSASWVFVTCWDVDAGTWPQYIVDAFYNYGEQIYPEICTDGLYYSSEYVYLTYSKQAVDYYPVYYTRSYDFGENWSDLQNVTGGAENSQWPTRPDIAYGYYSGLFISFEKLGWNGSSWINQAWVTKSTDYGSSWDTPLQLTSAGYGDGAHHTRVVAAYDVGTVLVAYTYDFGDPYYYDIASSYTDDGGTSWSGIYLLPWTYDDEHSVELAASRSASGRFHAAFRLSNDVHYTKTSVSSPTSWDSTTTVNDGNYASAVHPRPAVGINTAEAVDSEGIVAWTDFRDGWYNIYSDVASSGGGPAVTVSLSPDSTSIPRGGTLGYWVTVENTTGSTQCVYYWTNVNLPSGGKFPPAGELFGPYYLCLSAYQSRSAHQNQSIPWSAPLGTYTFNGYVGPYSTVSHEDHFNFTVTASTKSEGPDAWETEIDVGFDE